MINFNELTHRGPVTSVNLRQKAKMDSFP